MADLEEIQKAINDSVAIRSFASTDPIPMNAPRACGLGMEAALVGLFLSCWVLRLRP